MSSEASKDDMALGNIRDKLSNYRDIRAASIVLWDSVRHLFAEVEAETGSPCKVLSCMFKVDVEYRGEVNNLEWDLVEVSNRLLSEDFKEMELDLLGKKEAKQ